MITASEMRAFLAGLDTDATVIGRITNKRTGEHFEFSVITDLSSSGTALAFLEIEIPQHVKPS